MAQTVAPYYLVLMLALAVLFMGCLWQIDVSIINQDNGWPFMYLFNIISVDNWQARDFMYCLALFAFFGEAFTVSKYLRL